MKLSRYSGGKPQCVEDRIRGGALHFANDPVLYPRQTFGRLMDVVAIDIGDGFEQLLDTFILTASRWGCQRMGTASRHQSDRARSIVLSHPTAFPHGVPAFAETNNSALTQNHPLAG
jgi:hypothetical protein